MRQVIEMWDVRPIRIGAPHFQAGTKHCHCPLLILAHVLYGPIVPCAHVYSFSCLTLDSLICAAVRA